MDRKPRQVKLPFKPYNREKLLDGTKTATTRTKRFGHPGDTFVCGEGTFRINQVKLCNLQLVKRFYYDLEGFSTADGFVDCWKAIHPRKGWVPSQAVYLHIFERMDNTNGKES